MNDVIQKIYDIGIVPVIAIDDADKAVPLAKALVKGGLPAPQRPRRPSSASWPKYLKCWWARAPC